MGGGFSVHVLKSKLEIALKRMQTQINKRSNGVKIARREIAKLLADKKDESARIRVEAVLHEIHLIEVMEILSLMCQLLSARVSMLASEKYVPDDLVEASASIIFCAKRLQIPELVDIAKQFASRFGEEWVKLHVNNQAEKVNAKILDKLSIKPPEFQVVIDYLHDVAKQYNVAWEPSFVEDSPKGNNYAMGSVAPVNFNEVKIEALHEAFKPGTLNVVVHECSKLYSTQLFGQMDPYCILYFGRNNDVQHRTRVQKSSGLILVFHEEHFPFAIKQPGQKIRLEVWNKNKLLDDFIGRVFLDCDMLIENPQKTTYRLGRGDYDKTDAGQVVISTQFMPYHPDDDDDEVKASAAQQPGMPPLPPGPPPPGAMPYSSGPAQYGPGPVPFPAVPGAPPAYGPLVPGYPTPTPTPQSPPQQPAQFYPPSPYAMPAASDQNGFGHQPPPKYEDPPGVSPRKPAGAVPDVDELVARFKALQS